MNKEKFLMELREYLRILENQEQEDILDEYAQHIDMKMRKGLSEEEAIQDFGPMEELAAQILGAYHVKPEFRERGFLRIPKVKPNSADEGMTFLKRGGRWFKKVFTNIIHGIGNGFRWGFSKCRALAGWLARPFTRDKTSDMEIVRKSTAKMEGTDEMGGKIGNFFRMIGHGIAVSWKWLLSCCMFWLRICWNAGWLLFSGLCAFMALTALMGVGAEIVFLFQGYPFVGIFILSIGGMLCFGSLAYGAFGLMIRKKKDTKEEPVEGTDVEVAYEQSV